MSDENKRIEIDLNLDLSLDYPQEQFLHPPQQIQIETGALEARHIGRPPREQQTQHNSSRADAIKNYVGDKEINPPYPWATNKPAVHQTARDLFQKGVTKISGKVCCKSCDNTQTLEYDLQNKFPKLLHYIEENIEGMRNRAPDEWMNPKLTSCETCGGEMKPVIGEKKEEINWLFLLLGQMLGCCTLDQLKFFCESIKEHRTGSKNHILYSAYLNLCRQLEPDAKF